MNTLHKDLALNLRTFRNRLGLTQSELADRAKVSRRLIQRIEAGVSHNATLSVVAALAHALNLLPAQLLETRRFIMAEAKNIERLNWAPEGFAMGFRNQFGQVTEASPSFLEIADMPREKIISASVCQLITERSLAQVNALKPLYTSGGGYDLTVEYKGRKAPVIVSSRTFPCFTPEGRALGVMGIVWRAAHPLNALSLEALRRDIMARLLKGDL